MVDHFPGSSWRFFRALRTDFCRPFARLAATARHVALGEMLISSTTCWIHGFAFSAKGKGATEAWRNTFHRQRPSEVDVCMQLTLHLASRAHAAPNRARSD
ncbi:MAG: hypothetical protein FJX25_18105 [Alphaproteobacteria bacterium]|nr:hypothetical protein [Alphaproteobacteria bacterium]